MKDHNAQQSQRRSSRSSLVVHDITKSFASTPVLTGISLEIGQGESVAVMGPSGSGKSTLLHCMSGVLVPDDGEIRYGDTVVSRLNDAKGSALRLREFGFVFQDGQLLPELTAQENVALPAILQGTSRKRAYADAADMLKRLGLGKLIHRRPGKMSGGQAQRVAIARAIAAKPAIIFADEPTGALDQSTGHEVMQQLIAITEQAGSTLVMVTHDQSVANWCQRRIEIRDGIIHDDRMLPGAVS